MLHHDRIALIISIASFFVISQISARIFENIPHIEDEMAYVWQARVIARGELMIASPPCPNCFLVPFVVDYNGHRFGKYPLGWSIVLSFGEKWNFRQYVNPFFGAVSIWLTYLLAKKITNPGIGLLSAFLLSTSPFFLMNSSTLLSHTWSLFLTLGFALGWLDTFLFKSQIPRWITSTCSALCLGVLATTRPMTAVGVGLPFAIHGVWLLFHRNKQNKILLLYIGGIAGCIGATHFLWQYAVTGDPFLNPYTLWWSYDTVGFGPGVGVQEGGYKPTDAIYNHGYSLYIATLDFFGWPYVSWLYLPFGVISLQKNKPAWLIFSIFGGLIFAYSFYWIGSWLVGPRYYFEALPGVTIFTSAGIVWTVGKLKSKDQSFRNRRVSQIRFTLGALFAILFITFNLKYYTPMRLQGMYGLYGAKTELLSPFQSPQAYELSPALVIVTLQRDWIEYGALLDLSSPFLDSPFIFMLNQGDKQNSIAIHSFPNRKLIYYFPDQPYVFYMKE